MSLKPQRVDFQETWSVLVETVKGVITCGAVPRHIWNDRFSDVYKFCVAYPDPLGDRLYTVTKDFLEEHVTKLSQDVGNGDESLLSTYHKHWKEYSQGSGYLHKLYGYLNTTFIKKQKHSDADLSYGGYTGDAVDQMLEIGELALDIWKRLMIEPTKTQLINLLLEEIKKDRSGITVNQTVVHGVINSFVNVEEYKSKNPMQLYESLFETPFLQETGEYYRQEARQLKDECTCSEYMEKVIQKLDNEDFRSRKFLHPTSYSKVTQECQQRVVADHLQFLHGECGEMVHKENRKGLSNMYILLRPIPAGLGVLVEQVEDHIKQIGLDVVTNLKGDNIPAQFVESMLEVHAKHTELIESVFNKDQQFIGALDRACAHAINFRVNPKANCKSPEMLSTYCDNLLKKSSKGISETELDEKLLASITIFKYLDDKDVFQRYYSKMLARRLIHGLSTSMDAEESLINRLKQLCGHEFTAKLHRMFMDMNLSMELTSKFHEVIKRDNINLGVNFNILILQAGSWPLGQTNLIKFDLPLELEKSVQRFEEFYKGKHIGRKLTWLHQCCTGDIKFNFTKKTYIVTMGTVFMSVLLMFNDIDVLSWKDIQQHTDISPKELTKFLQTLVNIKIVTTQQGNINEDSTFSVNYAYSNKRTKFRIATAIQKDTEEVTTHQAVDEYRQMYLQAAIVRIMKARKILKHTLLINEVISQSNARFKPSVNMIKKCIEKLIDKEYLKRTPNSTDEYSYIA